jgi:hypothetical protein
VSRQAELHEKVNPAVVWVARNVMRTSLQVMASQSLFGADGLESFNLIEGLKAAPNDAGVLC